MMPIEKEDSELEDLISDDLEEQELHSSILEILETSYEECLEEALETQEQEEKRKETI